MAAFLLTHLWQSTLVLVLAWALARACRRNAAEVRYWIWLIASVKFLVPLPLLQQLGDQIGRSLPKPLPVDVTLVETANAMFVPSIPQSLALGQDLLSPLAVVAAGIWALGVAVLCSRWILQWRAIRSLVAFAPQVSMDLPVPVRITADERTTGVFGIVRPVVILPRQLMQALDARQLQAVLAHEVCHVRRHDNLTAAIHRCVEVLFWFHPLVWRVGANLIRERELACDEAVVEEGHEQEVYAESILSACRLGVMAQLPAVAASTGGDLCERLTSIMSERRAQPITRQRFSVLFAMANLLCFAPLAVGITVGAFREASDAGPVVFDTIELEQAEPGRWRSSRFEPQSGRLVLQNFSLRQLIVLAYPAAIVHGDWQTIDAVHYDIRAQWRAEGGLSERNLYRVLLQEILHNNSNLELRVTSLH